MARFRVPTLLLVAVIGSGPMLALATPDCSSCCPMTEERVPTLSALSCCGDGCAEQLAAGKDDALLTSAAPAVLKSPALTTIVVSPRHLSLFFDAAPLRFLWLPASARPGMVPLRL